MRTLVLEASDQIVAYTVQDSFQSTPESTFVSELFFVEMGKRQG